MSEMYQSDLPSPWTLDIKYDRWSRKWKSEVTKPNSLQQQASKQYFEACQRIFTHHHDNGKTVRLGSEEHSLQKAR